MSSSVVKDSLERWENASAHLEKALQAYLDSCSDLESAVTKHPVTSNNIPSTLNRTKESLYPRLAEQIPRSQLALTRIHKLTHIIYRLPDEIIAWIFWIAVSDAVGFDPFITPSLTARYECLYRLLRVCSPWRRIGLSERTLWSVIPWFGSDRPYHKLKALKKCLERAGDVSDLHFVGCFDELNHSVLPILVENASRFRTINIHTEKYRYGDRKAINRISETIVEHSPSGKITEFSIRYQGPGFPLATKPDYLFTQGSSHHILFRNFASSLRVLRFGGLTMSWVDFSFPALVEFRIQEVMIEKLHDLLLSLSSAPNLRRLEVIAITVHHETTDSKPPTAVTLPKLEMLYVEDLHQNTLELAFSLISPGPYQVILHCTACDCLTIFQSGVEVNVDPKRLSPLESVDVLMISGTWNEYDNKYFTPFLSSLPNLKALYIRKQTLSQSALKALAYSSEKAENTEFPKLDTLYLVECTIQDTDDRIGFKEVVTSHSIQELGFSGNFTSAPNFKDVCAFETDEMGPLRDWLDANVPKFRVIPVDGPSRFGNIDFETGVWKVW